MKKEKVGRNQNCPCGSGKKYKKCCAAGKRDRNIFRYTVTAALLLVLCLMSYSFAALLSGDGHVRTARSGLKSSAGAAESINNSDADRNTLCSGDSGILVAQAGTQGTDKNNYLYTGEQYDADTGLYYPRARHYDPETGRFLTPDSWEGDMTDPASLNRYTYADANPVNRTDPSGHFSLGEISTANTIRNILTEIQFNTGMGLADAHDSAQNGNNGDKYLEEQIGGLFFMVTGIVPRAFNIIGKNKILKNVLKGMPLSEAKSLMSKWDKSTYSTLAQSIRDHANRHGFGQDIPKYLRKAANFNKKGAKNKILDDGAVRWYRQSGEFLIERNGKIVSYGIN